MMLHTLETFILIKTPRPLNIFRAPFGRQISDGCSHGMTSANKALTSVVVNDKTFSFEVQIKELNVVN